MGTELILFLALGASGIATIIAIASIAYTKLHHSHGGNNNE